MTVTDSPLGLTPERTLSLPWLLGGQFHRMAVHEWGDPAAPPVLCVHGLTRNGRDFDILAAALADRFHVLCPDLPGRGQSDWLPDPAAYAVPTYLQALGHLLAHIARPVAWVGTSLGGICGMGLAAATGAPIRCLILNDIGPHVGAPALARIGAYISHYPIFATPAELEAHLRQVHAPFGRLSDAQWAALAQHSARTLPDGTLAMHYDPAIAAPFKTTPPEDLDLSAVWARITIPRLAIRGAASDLLSAETYDAMRADGAAGLVVADAGHAPALMDQASIGVVRGFLEVGV